MFDKREAWGGSVRSMRSIMGPSLVAAMPAVASVIAGATEPEQVRASRSQWVGVVVDERQASIDIHRS